MAAGLAELALLATSALFAAAAALSRRLGLRRQAAAAAAAASLALLALSAWVSLSAPARPGGPVLPPPGAGHAEVLYYNNATGSLAVYVGPGASGASCYSAAGQPLACTYYPGNGTVVVEAARGAGYVAVRVRYASLPPNASVVYYVSLPGQQP